MLVLMISILTGLVFGFMFNMSWETRKYCHEFEKKMNYVASYLMLAAVVGITGFVVFLSCVAIRDSVDLGIEVMIVDALKIVVGFVAALMSARDGYHAAQEDDSKSKFMKALYWILDEIEISRKIKEYLNRRA